MSAGITNITLDTEFTTLILRSGKPALVEFSTGWAGVSHLNAPVIRELAESFAGRLSFYHVDAQKHKELITRYNIRQIPTILLFDKGRPRDHAAGLIPRSVITEKIDMLLAHSAESECEEKIGVMDLDRNHVCKRMLIPVDDSTTSQQAVEYGFQLAASGNASVTLHHVLTPKEAGRKQFYADKLQLMGKTAASLYYPHLLPSRYQRHTNGASLHTAVTVADDIASAILTLAEDRECDLIVSGTHGRSGVKKLIWGSVARNLVRHARIPLITMHEGWHSVPPAKILIPVDFSPYSRQAIEWATVPLWGMETEIHFLHVDNTELHLDHFLFNREPYLTANPEYTEEMYKKLYDITGRWGSNIIHVIKEGKPGTCIRDYAESRNIELIIMPVRGMSTLEHLLVGSTTEYIVQTAPCPVFTVGRCNSTS